MVALRGPAEPAGPLLSTRQKVEAGLRNAVIDRDFLPGQHLSDRMLCERFGASRSIVREAVRLLEAEGLLTVLPNRGTFVTRLTAAEASHAYEVRGVLEALAGEACAIRASEREREALRLNWERFAGVSPEAESSLLLSLKQDFISALLAGCHNPLIARTLDQVLNRISQIRAVSLVEPGRLKQTCSELRRVVEAVEQRDPEGAWDACRVHVRRSATVALRVLRMQEREVSSRLRRQRPSPVN